jgi:hypothetical protein
MELFVGLEPVIFDVGCNKGYDTAMMFEAFTPQVGPEHMLCVML